MDMWTSMVSAERFVRKMHASVDGSTEVAWKHIFDSVKHSLERLQLDYIDVLQCERQSLAFFVRSFSNTTFEGHRFDPETAVSETVSRSWYNIAVSVLLLIYLRY